MPNENPATPPQGATPGSNEPGSSTPSGTTPPASTPGQGNPPEGQVTISTKEYADLQRAKARAAALDRRNALKTRQSTGTPPAGNGDPDDQTAQELAQLKQDNAEKDRLLMQARLTGKVRELLDKEEFKALPKVARDLILKDPSVLSKADNEEEALLDIEDFVRESVAGMGTPAAPSSKPNDPPGHETPPKPSNGGTTPAEGSLEDTSKLRGDARAMATLRNVIRKSKI